MKLTKNSLILGFIVTISWASIAIGARLSPITSRGMNVFSRRVVLAYGGVVLQGTTKFYNNSGNIISPSSLKIQFDTQLDKPQQVCIAYKGICYEIGVSSQNAIPLATWVFSGQTGAFTAFPPEEDEIVELEDIGNGYVPTELAQGTIPQILSFIDFYLKVEEFDDNEIRNEYNKRLGSNFNPALLQEEDGSYIMTDTDTEYEARLITNKQVQLTGLINRYYWQLFQGVEYPYITKVRRACTPASIKATNNKQCSLVGKRPPREVEKFYAAQKEALLLIQTTAIFRTFADNNCKELNRFLKAHSKTYNFPANQCEKLRDLAKEEQSN